MDLERMQPVDRATEIKIFRWPLFRPLSAIDVIGADGSLARWLGRSMSDEIAKKFLADLEEATAHFREQASLISQARVLPEITDADYQMQFDRIKAEYFQRVEELRTRFQHETLRACRPAGRSWTSLLRMALSKWVMNGHW
jgi:hypothetical protein